MEAGEAAGLQAELHGLDSAASARDECPGADGVEELGPNRGSGTG